MLAFWLKVTYAIENSAMSRIYIVLPKFISKVFNDTHSPISDSLGSKRKSLNCCFLSDNC